MVVTDGQPDATGLRMAKALAEHVGVPVTMVLDCGTAYIMETYDPNTNQGRQCTQCLIEMAYMQYKSTSTVHGLNMLIIRVDMVLVGAEAVVESGGIVNKLGTYQIAVVARSRNVPFYVAAESYKFARLYPLHQRDLPFEAKPVDVTPLLPPSTKMVNPSRDYTPPGAMCELIT